MKLSNFVQGVSWHIQIYPLYTVLRTRYNGCFRTRTAVMYVQQGGRFLEVRTL